MGEVNPRCRIGAVCIARALSGGSFTPRLPPAQASFRMTPLKERVPPACAVYSDDSKKKVPRAVEGEEIVRKKMLAAIDGQH